MNLFKLLNISAIFILLCLGIVISSTIKEVDAPFLAIPRVAFETAVPAIDEEQDNQDEDKAEPIRLIDDAKTGLFVTKFMDGLLPFVSRGKEKASQLMSKSLDEPLARITLIIDSSNSSISVSIDKPDNTKPPSESLEEKLVVAVHTEANLEQPLENHEPSSQSPVDVTMIEELEPQVQQVIVETQLTEPSAEETMSMDLAVSTDQENVELVQAEEPAFETIEIPVEVFSPELESAPGNKEQSFENSSNSPMVNQLPLGNNPLTGLAPEAEEKLERRPMMVKISNFPRSGRPQAGLSYADMVFEYYIGEEMNRFLAIYYGSDSPQVGPIRSGALVDSQIANLYQGIVNYGNEDPQVDGLLTKSLESRALPVWRSSSPAIEGADSEDINGVFGNSQELSILADKINISNSRQSLKGMLFSDVVPEDFENSHQVAVEYSERNRGEWRYDAETGLFERWSENFKDGDYFMEPLYDRVNNQQVSFANVIIIFADYDEVNPTRYKIDLTGNREGETALIFRDGIMVPGLWKVTRPDQPIQFFDRDEEPIALKPGNTWVVIVDFDSEFGEIEYGDWEVQFSLH